jgi:hypothetical protein
MRSAEVSTVERLSQSFEDLKCVGICGMEAKKAAQNVFGPALGGLPI